MTQKALKTLIESGAAKDISVKGELPKGSTKIAYSSGTYGINGALWISKTGKLYAIVGRGGNLFKYT